MTHEREEPHVPVALTGQRDDAKQFHEHFLALKPGKARDQIVDRATERVARDGVEEVGVDALHLGGQHAHVVGDGVRRGWLSGARGAGSAQREHTRGSGEREPHANFLSSPRTHSAHVTECSAPSIPSRSRK